MYGGQRSLFSTLIFETGSLTEPEAHLVSKTGWPASPRNMLLSPPFPVPVLVSVYVDAGWKAGLHACTISTLLSEPFPRTLVSNSHMQTQELLINDF